MTKKIKDTRPTDLVFAGRVVDAAVERGTYDAVEPAVQDALAESGQPASALGQIVAENTASSEEPGFGLFDAIRVVVDVHHEGRDTRAQALARLGTELVAGEGAAVLNPADHYVEVIGERIAVGRAIEDLGRKVAETWGARAVTEAELAERRGRPVS